VTEKGLIVCMKYENGNFAKPQIVLEESFHLSYPYVFEKDGTIYMMPETSADGCIQLYKAVDFPYKWEKEKILVKIKNAVDTVISGDYLVASVVTDAAAMKVDVELYNIFDGKPYLKNPVEKCSQTARGAGKIFQVNGRTIRPAQDCTDAVYGAGLVFYEIKEDNGFFTESIYKKLSTSDIKVENGRTPCGVHTYARCKGIEIIDYKMRRFNLRRILWIIKKKI